MLFQEVNKKDILKIVQKELGKGKKEILATMLLSKEFSSPLPASYHDLMKKKISEGVVIKRLGFGKRGEYTKIKKILAMISKNYQFRYSSQVDKYQRLLIIDRKILFFGIHGLFFQSTYKPLVQAFLQYFEGLFKKGNI